jgi:CheY-like chemotaxis protein
MTEHLPIILYVEDDPEWRKAILPKICNERAEVVGLTNAQDVFEFLSHTRPQLVVVDLHLSGSTVSGFDLAKHLMSVGQNVLAISTSPSLGPARVPTADKGNLTALRSTLFSLLG